MEVNANSIVMLAQCAMGRKSLSVKRAEVVTMATGHLARDNRIAKVTISLQNHFRPSKHVLSSANNNK